MPLQRQQAYYNATEPLTALQTSTALTPPDVATAPQARALWDTARSEDRHNRILASTHGAQFKPTFVLSKLALDEEEIRKKGIRRALHNQGTRFADALFPHGTTHHTASIGLSLGSTVSRSINTAYLEKTPNALQQDVFLSQRSTAHTTNTVHTTGIILSSSEPSSLEEKVISAFSDKSPSPFALKAGHLSPEQFDAWGIHHEYGHHVDHQVRRELDNNGTNIYQKYLKENIADVFATAIMMKEGHPPELTDSITAYRTMNALIHKDAYHFTGHALQALKNIPAEDINAMDSDEIYRLSVQITQDHAMDEQEYIAFEQAIETGQVVAAFGEVEKFKNRVFKHTPREDPVSPHQMTSILEEHPEIAPDGTVRNFLKDFYGGMRSCVTGAIDADYGLTDDPVATALREQNHPRNTVSVPYDMSSVKGPDEERLAESENRLIAYVWPRDAHENLLETNPAQLQKRLDDIMNILDEEGRLECSERRNLETIHKRAISEMERLENLKTDPRSPSYAPHAQVIDGYGDSELEDEVER